MNKVLNGVLSKYEIYSYISIWVAAFSYCGYTVYLGSRSLESTGASGYLKNGWLLERNMDVGDYEWSEWKPMLKTVLPWCILNLILAEFTRWCMIEALPLCYLLVTNLFLMIKFGPIIVLIIFFKILLYFIILRFRSVWATWIITLSVIGFVNRIFPSTLFYLGITESSDIYFVVTSSAWLELKCTSFCIDYIRNPNSKQDILTFVSFLGYAYYFPLFLFGPYLLHEEYEKGVKSPFAKWTFSRLATLLFNMLRYIGWMVFLDGVLHFFYIHSLEYYIADVNDRGYWHLNGLGLLSGMFFCVKYISTYGLFITITRAENYNAPPVPKCSCRAYNNSVLWRTFDVGFYQFIRKYIYVPLLGKNKINLGRKFFASALAFSFVFMWHGLYIQVFLWSLLNYLQLSVESVMVYLSKTESFKGWVDKNFTAANRIRLKALAYSPFSLYVLIANSLFYAPNDVSTLFFTQFLTGDAVFFITVFVISYASCMSGLILTDWEKNKAPQISRKN